MVENIVLAGFMGTGKSTVGPIVADRLGWQFVDTDEFVESMAGLRIPELFARGEDVFRKFEAMACQQVALGQQQVIAVGGGALLDAASRQVLARNGLMICLVADLDTIMARVGDDPHRPLFRDRASVKRLLADRADHYASLPHTVDTTGKSPRQVADEVIQLWQQS